MKKYFLHILIASLFSFAGSIALAQDNSAFENGFSLRLGVNLPSSSFGTFDFENSGGGNIEYKGSKVGYGLELGMMFFLDGIDLGEKMMIGIDVAFLDLNFISADYVYTPVGPNATPEEATLGFFQMGMMVGPSFSFSPADKMSLDLAFKFNPAWSVFGSNNENVADFGLSLFTLNYVPALYFRYSVLLLGLEYNITKGNHEIGTTANGGTFTDVKVETNMNRLKFLIGFKF